MMPLTSTSVSSTKIIIASLMRDKKEIRLPSHCCNLMIICDGRKLFFFFLVFFQSPVTLESIYAKITHTMFSSPKVTTLSQIYRTVGQGGEAPLVQGCSLFCRTPLTPCCSCPVGPGRSFLPREKIQSFLGVCNKHNACL